MISLNFILTALVIVLIPGTGVIYTINTGLSKSSKYAVAAAIGCTIGIVPHMSACILGLSAIMNMSAKVFMLIKYLGAAYLLYLAWKTWSSSGNIEFGKDKIEPKFMDIAIKGIIINLLNPKLTLFFLSFLPQFIPVESTNQTECMILLSIIFMLMTLIIFIGYGMLAAFIREIVITKKNVMKNVERSFACIFAGLAVKLALQDN